MNRAIRTLAVGCLVLFLALLVNVNYLQFVNADALSSHTDNRRVRDAEYSRERGPILVAGNPIARSVRVDDQYRYLRRYPQSELYAHLTGYYSYIYGRSGIEASQNDVLSGADPRLFADQVADLLGNSQPQGGSVALTVDPRAQQAAHQGLLALPERAKGAVVALDPQTGAVLALSSLPSYNPNRLATHDLDAEQQAWKRLNARPDQPMFDRGTQQIYPPGSTFKLVTAAAALSSGRFTPQSLVPGGFTLDLPQTSRDLINHSGGSCGPERISMTEALRISCNVSFGWLGLQLGADALREQAQKFGFGEDVFDDVPTAPSVFPEEVDEPQAAQSAIGQFEVAATPLQMAMVTAGIANGGVVMQPYLVDEVRSPDLDVLSTADPQELSTAVSSEVAAKLTAMMVEVVRSGTGAPAQIPGLSVAGKTGTAQSAPDRPPYAWFVSFAPADDPQVAVAVLIEDANVPREAITGGGLAGPIAKAVMEAVINR
ncbi:MAG TPA: penicillin-binding protein 2 [Nocardioidaceae bacterium]|jgi:peptidoglycan glycosyltransferase|nr:penicillin-binding protein 2 [Nocardioidaceae bacterium]